MYAAITPLKFFKIYAGGGIDVIFEKKGPIPLPVVEAGISIKPGAIVSFSADKKNNKLNTFVSAVYFEKNSVSIDENYLSVLNEIGEKLKNPKRKLTLRAYHAPDGVEMQVRYGAEEPALSAARISWCIEYLLSNYNIDASRIKFEFVNAHNKEDFYRRIELIIK